MDENIYLTDLLSSKQLQKMQDAFSRMTGLAALTTDHEGKPVTDGSNFTRYCMQYTRQTELGCERCNKCDISGAQKTLETGKPTIYVCHSGLIDFAAPIMVGDRLIGSFIGGQALFEKPDKSKIKAIADEIGVDFAEYWDALMEVPIIERAQIEMDAEFLYETAEILSDIAYGKYMAIQSQRETEKAANMKSDFLANMSHEIRTPMNAVIGLAEMALREEMSPVARDYITQIKSSGNTLLNIINDVLDFSKIESGKMDIIPEKYELLSALHDVSSILMTRLRDKDVELVCKINPKLPKKLIGDILRIRQIVINLANNAIKFTNHGFILINVDYEKKSHDEIVLKVEIKDTGIGIKKEDLGKLFSSFSQVDSKRNRNVEGTGLGLAITARLLKLMGGNISVSSVYGEGSCFKFTIPQKVASWEPSIQITNPDKKIVMGYWRGVNGVRSFYDELTRLGVNAISVPTLDRLDKIISLFDDMIKDRDIYLFTTDYIYKNEMTELVDRYPNIHFIVVSDFFASTQIDKSNVRIIKKPFSTVGIAVALNNDEILTDNAELFEFDFVAPDANVMIVDDNDVNLVIAEGLLEPLKMNITGVNSGKKCLEYLKNNTYDIIFMDHMMPDMDGVETTHIIRRLHPELENMPIIALTANAVGEAKKMFIAEGMNDFVAKPIEVKTIVNKVRQWLPDSKVKKQIDSSVAPSATDKGIKVERIDGKICIVDLDVNSAIAMLGSEKMYFTVLEKYYKIMRSKLDIIKNSEETEDVDTYTIEVHALKSSSRQIGANELADMAAELENCGKVGDIETIHAKTDVMLDKYKSYMPVFASIFVENNTPSSKKKVSGQVKLDLLRKLLEAVEFLDMEGMDYLVAELDKYSYADDEEILLEQLKQAVESIDMDVCEDIIAKWKKII